MFTVSAVTRTGNYAMKMESGRSNVKDVEKVRAQHLKWRDHLLKAVNVRPARQKEVNLLHDTKCPLCGKPQRVNQTYTTTICEGQECTRCRGKFVSIYILGFCNLCSNRVECLPFPTIEFLYDASVE
jgi:hypothetical protein